MKKHSDTITLFTVKNLESVNLLCSVLKGGAEIHIEPPPSKRPIKVILRNGEFHRKRKKEKWNKQQFLMNTQYLIGRPVAIRFKRSDFIDEYQKFSDTEIARKLGDDTLALTMKEMAEEGKDVWGA